MPDDSEVPTRYAPALSASTPVDRVVSLVFGAARYPYRSALAINNKSVAIVTVTIMGIALKIGPGQVYPITREMVGGPIRAYTLEADQAVTAGDLEVFEYGGLIRE